MCYQQKKKYFIGETLHRNIKVNTKYKSRAETENIKKEITEENITKPTNEKGVNTRKKKECRYRPTRKKDKMAVLSPHPLIITLNVNGLNSPIKRHRVAGWIKKQDLSTCCLQETHVSSNDKHRLKVKGSKMILQAHDSQKEVDVISVCTLIRQNTL